ncbi:MAG: Holliday junction branch migration protein RuvA [Peptococcaceae bacterium]|jgi:Holliday junction DNA helicase RuvA|nr:Holliday junction branch migration protein RuvA [Peptococcaceae bacterium]
MIGMLRGEVWEIEPGTGMGTLCLDVHGVGYEMAVTSAVLGKARIGQALTVYTKLIPREDEIALYGFASAREKHLFLKMLSVSGIGPKGAMGVLSALGVQQIEQALASGNTQLLTQVPGIGKKTAQRLVLELKEKFKGMSLGDEAASGAGVEIGGSEALESLLVLGFAMEEARQALGLVEKDQPGLGLEEQIKQALRLLARREV